MKRILSAIVFLLATFAAAWFFILALSTPYGEPGRAGYIAGLSISFIVALGSIAFGDSDKWKKGRR